MLKHYYLGALLAAALAGCVPSNTRPVVEEPLDPAPSVAAPCQRAQENLLRLGCKDSEGRLLGGPNKAGDTFSAVCQNAVANHVNVNPVCIASVVKCSEVDTCPR